MLHLQQDYVIIHSIKNQVLGEKMKKIITLAILCSLTFAYTAPVFAIQNTDKSVKVSSKKEKKAEIKITPAKNKCEYINLEWWQNFNDENLNNYIMRAVENNKDLKMATLNIDEYYQRVVAQRANELPSVYAGFLPAYGKMLAPSAQGSFALPIMASYEVDLWGKNHNKTTSAKKLWEASILDERAAYISIASAVGSSYINIVKLDALIDIQEEIVRLRKDIFELMEMCNKEGIVSTSDLVKANKSYMLAVTDLTDLKKNRSKMLHSMAVLIGDSPNNIEEITRTSYKDLKFNGVIPESVNAEIITQRPDYLKAEKMLEKAGIDVKIARKEMYPTITLGGGVLFNNRYFESLFTTSDALWGIGGGIIQPAFLGGRLRANLKSKKIAYEKSVKNYEKTALTSMQEVNDSLVSVNRDREKLFKQQEIQNLEQKDFEMTQEEYKEGVISKLDMEQKQENLLSINKLVYSTQFDCMVDYISYYKAVASKVQ